MLKPVLMPRMRHCRRLNGDSRYCLFAGTIQRRDLTVQRRVIGAIAWPGPDLSRRLLHAPGCWVFPGLRVRESMCRPGHDVHDQATSASRKRREFRTGEEDMEWTFVVALIVAIPIILFPVALVWFINVGGISAAVREGRARKVRRQNTAGAKLEQ